MARRPVRIAPSILSADFGRLAEQVAEVEAAGAELLHVDVMDGHFVPNLTFGPLVVRALSRVTDLPMHVHLMTTNPDDLINDFVSAGAHLITVHVETCPHLHRSLELIREAGALPAVTLNPATPASALTEVLAQVDSILVMTVDPGYGGQQLIPATLEKVAGLRRMLDERGLDACSIAVDGGVNMATLADVLDAGADTLVMGSAIFGHPEGIAEAMAQYSAAVEERQKPLPC